MYEMTLQVYFPEEDRVSVGFDSAAHGDEEAGFEARYHETHFFTLFAARQFANLRSRGGDAVAHSLAETLMYFDHEDPITDVRNELGAVRLVSAGRSEGGKGFTAEYRPRKRALFKMSAHGMGVLGGSARNYARSSVLAVLLHLLELRSDDSEYQHALASAAQLVGREAHRNAIGVRSEVKIAALAASEGWNPTEWSREVSQEVEDADMDEADDFGDEPSEPNESDLIKHRVQTYLREVAGSIEVDPTGDYSFRHGSARIYVSVLPGPRNVFIRVWSYVAFGSPESPDLYEYVATQAEGLPLMGALSAHKEQDGTVTTILEHALLGDSMGEEEFNLAVAAVATTADALDDVIVERFGGRTFH